jgi:hypothetical protein
MVWYAQPLETFETQSEFSYNRRMSRISDYLLKGPNYLHLTNPVIL